MPIKRYLFRLERMHHLIKRKSTGNPDQFAKKLEMSRSMLMNYLSEMKDLGAPVVYDAFYETYYYAHQVDFSPYFSPKEIEEKEMSKIKGGGFLKKNSASPIILDFGSPSLNCF